MTELEQQLDKLGYGEHLCPIHENVAESIASAAYFIKGGLARGDLCLYIGDERCIEAIIQALAAGEVDVPHERERGALWLLTKRDIYLKAGEFDPHEMIKFLSETQVSALANAFSGLRLVGEMSWALGPETSRDRLLEYEVLLNRFSVNSRSVILCQYSRERFSPAVIHDVLLTHPLAILGDLVCPNPFYYPPDLALRWPAQPSAELMAKRVDWRIRQLKEARVAQERERVLEELKVSERRLAEAQQVAHIGSWERDLRTNAVTWSDELYRLFGPQPHEDISYERFLNLVLPEEVDRIRAFAEEAIRGSRGFSFDYRIPCAGSIRVLRERGSVILGADGKPIRLVGTAQDVTERRKAEDALQESERKLVQAQRIAHFGYWEYDFDADRTTYSDEACRIIGIPLQSVRTLAEFRQLVLPEDRPIHSEAFARVLHSQGNYDVEYGILRPDGEVRFLHSIDDVIRDESGRPCRAFGVVQDITERKRAEGALRQSDDRIRLIIDAIPVMAWSIQADGIVGFLNQRWTDYTGLSLEQYVEEPTRPIHPEDVPRVIERWRAQMAAGEGYDDEMRLRRRDGEYRWFLVRTEPLRDEQGNIVTWYGVSTDIDDRKRAEQAVKASQQLLHTVLATLPVGVAVTDQAANVILVNPAWKRIWGDVIASGRERWARSKGFWHDSGARIDPENWASARALSKGETSLNELIDIESFDGQQKTIQASAAPIRNAEGTIAGAVIVIDDVTERVRAQKALRESAERLQHLSRRLLKVQEEERRHLARELHDEFGQILATITLHLHAAQGLAGDAARPRLIECAALLKQAGEQVRSLALELRPTMLDTLGLEATLRWLAEQHQQRTGCEVQLVGHLSGTTLTPEMAIACFRVAQEALTNVVRHAAARHVWIELSQSERVLELVVRDDGAGFEVVATQQQSGERRSLGLLGMAERVQLLGGTLIVESEPGHGTRIRATFPMSEAPEEPTGPAE